MCRCNGQTQEIEQHADKIMNPSHLRVLLVPGSADSVEIKEHCRHKIQLTRPNTTRSVHTALTDALVNIGP